MRNARGAKPEAQPIVAPAPRPKRPYGTDTMSEMGIVPMCDEPGQPVSESRPCTCHPDDNPPVPCAQPALRMPEPMTSSEISDYARAMVKGDRSVDWLAMQIEAEILRRVREANK